MFEAGLFLYLINCRGLLLYILKSEFELHNVIINNYSKDAKEMIIFALENDPPQFHIVSYAWMSGENK